MMVRRQHENKTPSQPPLSREILEAARQGLETRLQIIRHQIEHIRSLLGVRGRGRPHKGKTELGLPMGHALPLPSSKVSTEAKLKKAAKAKK